MRWGKMLKDPSEAEQAAAEGFDFVQSHGALVTGLSDDELLSQKARIADGGIAFEVGEVPLPADVRVTERGFNLYAWSEYLRNAVRRMAGLGCRVLVWSDGRARALPEEGEVADLKEQVLQFLFVLCDLVRGFGMAVLVEPLGLRRANFLNTLEGTRGFLSQAGKENLGLLVSLGELEAIGASPAGLAGCRKLIGHVHLERPGVGFGVRICPRPGDVCEYRPFLQALKAAAYAERICLPQDADAAGLAYCKRLWDG